MLAQHRSRAAARRGTSVAAQRRDRPRPGAGVAARRAVGVGAPARRRGGATRWSRSPTGARTASRRSRPAPWWARRLRAATTAGASTATGALHGDPGHRRRATTSRPRASPPRPPGSPSSGGLVFLAPEPPIGGAARPARSPTPTASCTTSSTPDPGARRRRAHARQLPRHGALPVRARGDHRHRRRARGARDDRRTRRVRHDRAPARHWFPNHEDPGVAAGHPPAAAAACSALRVPRAVPGRACSIDYVQAGGTNVLDFFVQPEDDEHCRVYTAVHRNDLDDADQHGRRRSRTSRRSSTRTSLLQEQYVDRRLPARHHRRGPRAHRSRRRSSCAASSPTS